MTTWPITHCCRRDLKVRISRFEFYQLRLLRADPLVTVRYCPRCRKGIAVSLSDATAALGVAPANNNVEECTNVQT